jgi:CRISPR-associated Csx2 family protein
MRKIFLSMLGTGGYKECCYTINGVTSEPVRFVQEALVKRFCRSWDKDDRIFIFCTEEATRKNWEDSGDIEGLGSRLKNIGLSAVIENVPIPSGKNESEIMEIFSTMINKIEKKDEVILDITHSFRSIPLLGAVVLNYAKTVKDISVKGIYYGAYEARDEKDGIEIAPVFDLTIYDNLLDWARAVEIFRKAGSASEIKKLLGRSIGPIFKNKANEVQEIAKYFSDFGNTLDNFCKDLLAVRGPNIENFHGFSEKIEKIEESELVPPMISLLDLLKEKLKPFDEARGIDKSFEAVKWCIDHGMVPQAYILMEEAVISELCRIWLMDPKEIKDREFWSSLLHVISRQKPDSEWEGELKERRQLAKDIISNCGESLREFAKVFDSLRGPRNDIAHGGWSESGSSTAKSLIDKVEKKLKDIKEVWPSCREQLCRYRERRQHGEAETEVNAKAVNTRRVFLVLSHELTETQVNELRENWKVQEVVPIPEDLASLWESINPEEESLSSCIRPIITWLEENSVPGDLILVQGDFGATFLVVDWALNQLRVPIYATTARYLEEHRLDDGRVEQKRIFQHVRFRKYEREKIFKAVLGNKNWGV